MAFEPSDFARGNNMRNILIALVLALLPIPALAQKLDLTGIQKRCLWEESDDARIRACSAELLGNNLGAHEFRATIYTSRGRAYMRKGDFDKALADVTHTLAESDRINGLGLNSDHTLALIQRGELYLKMGKPDLGKSDLSQCISNFSADIKQLTEDPPKKPDYRDWLGLTHNDRVMASLGTSYNGRASAYHLLGEDTLALPDVNKEIELNPKDSNSLEIRGEIYEKLGRREEAIADYRATMALTTGRRDDAIGDIRVVLTLATNFTAAKDGLARLGQPQVP